MISQVRPRTARIFLERMAWNLNTQKRHLKHNDAPPDDCPAWELSEGVPRLGRVSAEFDRQEIDQLIRRMLDRIEAHPNRWWRLALYGESGYQTTDGWVPDQQLQHYRKGATLLGPFCKEKGVLPDLVVDEDGLYALPFNLPEGVCAIPYDPAKPMLGQTPKEKVELETTPVPPGTVIEAFDDWGEPYTFEVV